MNLHIEKINKNGVVGDLGSISENVAYFTMQKEIGQELDAQIWRDAIKRAGKELLEDRVEKKKDGGFIYIARMRSLNGI